MTEQPQPAPAAAESAADPASAAAGDLAAPYGAADPAAPDGAADPASVAAVGTDDRPEIAVGAAFAGGFLAALILKRLGR